MNCLNSLISLLLLFSLSAVLQADPDAIHDICVADLTVTDVYFNGLVCKFNQNVTADDFSSNLLMTPGNTSNPLGYALTLANVYSFPGLHTFGISYARIDYALGGLNPPHVHPRGSELLYVQSGALYVGFVTTTGTLYAKTIGMGEIFIFPKGLIHFQIAKEPTLAIAALTSQNPGTSQVARATFASMPSIDVEVLKKAFQVTDRQANHMKRLIGMS